MSDIPQKRCTGPCGQEYPVTTEFWHRGNGPQGLRSECKICARARVKEHYNRPEVKERMTKQRRELYKQPEVRGRMSEKAKERNSRPEIKEKKKAHNEEYKSRPGVKERAQKRQKEYHSRPEIQEHTRERQKEYRNRPEVKQHITKQKKEHSALPEIKEQRKTSNERRKSLPGAREHAQKRKKVYRSRPEIQERHRIHQRVRNARKKGILGTYTHEQIQDQLERQRRKCYYCHVRLKKAKGRYIYHIEHTFPLSRVAGMDIPANSIDYIVLACPTCNVRKHNKFPWEFPEGGRLV